MGMKKRDAALDALNAIVKALRPLSAEERSRVIMGAQAVLGGTSPPVQVAQGGGAPAVLAVVPPPAPVEAKPDENRAAAEAMAHRRNQMTEQDLKEQEANRIFLAQMKAQRDAAVAKARSG